MNSHSISLSSSLGRPLRIKWKINVLSKIRYAYLFIIHRSICRSFCRFHSFSLCSSLASLNLVNVDEMMSFVAVVFVAFFSHFVLFTSYNWVCNCFSVASLACRFVYIQFLILHASKNNSFTNFDSFFSGSIFFFMCERVWVCSNRLSSIVTVFEWKTNDWK